MLHRTKLDQYGLDDWMEEFNEIYGSVNEKRSIETIWLHAVEHASAIHEDLRIADYEKALRHIADLLCWLCAFATKAESKLSTKASLLDIVLSKYPRICFYCGQRKCICLATIGRRIEDPVEKAELRKEALARATVARESLRRDHEDPRSLQDVVDMFVTIYEHINFRTPLEVIVAHLQEEVGEVASCLNDFTDKPDLPQQEFLRCELEHEMADIITWTVALLWKLDYILGAGRVYLEQRRGPLTERPAPLGPHSLGVTLSDVLWENFQTPDGNTLWCPSCKERPCRLPLPSRLTA